MKIAGVDVVDRHLSRARGNVRRVGLDRAITIEKLEYHHLDRFPDETVDAVYTMETFVHSTDPAAALVGSFRVLKPGGSLAVYEYRHAAQSDAQTEMVGLPNKVNKYAAMPASMDLEEGTGESLLENVGFCDVKAVDLSENVKPMLRLFFVAVYVHTLSLRLLVSKPTLSTRWLLLFSIATVVFIAMWLLVLGNHLLKAVVGVGSRALHD